MMLFTKPITEQLMANGRESLKAILKDGNTPDHKPVCKLFTPDGGATWLISEMEVDEDGATGRLFGLCDLGIGYPEVGYVNLEELRTLRGKLGLPVERDYHFTADKTLSEYAADATRHDRIVT